MVGSFEPRKNHLGVLQAAEGLWRQGLDFEVVFIGGSGWGTDLPERIAALRRQGRPVTQRQGVGEAELEAAYRSARLSVFPSVHEGFGLPVAESLALGTPVITSDFGSMRELASGGGAIMVDPYDDEALEAAMGRLLTDDTELEALRTQITSRPRRDWDDYARDLWDTLVAPMQGSGAP
jgi:glycosyltransferase involved in cell wall biosynthesis